MARLISSDKFLGIQNIPIVEYVRICMEIGYVSISIATRTIKYKEIGLSHIS